MQSLNCEFNRVSSCVSLCEDVEWTINEIYETMY